jgi:hypothetical protein
MNKRLFNYLAALGLLLLSQGAIASCNGVIQKHAHIQWSNSASIVSPRGGWQLEVHPDLTSDENNSQVSLRRCSDGRSSKLFTLERTAEIYWSPDGDRLLVINQPTRDVSKLIFLDAKSLFDANESPLAFALGDELQSNVQQRLGASRRIEFYLVNFVSWSNKTLTLSVSGATSSGADGPMTPYCYDALLDTGGALVNTHISGDDLRSKFDNSSCKVFP